MNYNPYAAPQAAPGPMMGGAPPPPQGGAQPWEPGEVFSLAWDGFKRNWGVLVGVVFVQMLITQIPSAIANGIVQSGAVDPGSAAASGISGACSLIGAFLGAFLAAGVIKVFLTAARGGVPNFGDMFGGGNKLLPILGTQILMGLAIVVGFILLIVPGIILSLGLCLSTYYVADADYGPIDAMKASWAATNGSKGKLFLLGLIGFLVMIVGVLACCVGALASIAVYTLAMGIVFVRLSGRGTTPSGFD
ncbi:MAG TPA: hypothetical protein VF407_17755, partial [Polyangiaceae bacterium]